MLMIKAACGAYLFSLSDSFDNVWMLMCSLRIDSDRQVMVSQHSYDPGRMDLYFRFMRCMWNKLMSIDNVMIVLMSKQIKCLIPGCHIGGL